MSLDMALAELQTLLGDRLSRVASVRNAHAQSETHITAGPPDAVAFPRTTAEVATLARICSSHGVPMVGWGAGTSLEGHALAVRGGVTVDFQYMDQVLAVHSEDMIAVVQPGITREKLNEELRATGLFFPVDPGANASLGGMTATRASGTTAVRYGTMRANVLGLEAVLADGRVIRTGSSAPKTAAGYDLTALFVGSEGTLGLITEITLRLQGQPEAVSAAVCAFPDFAAAVDCVIATVQTGIPMARIEFLDETAVRACNAHSGENLPEAPSSACGISRLTRRCGRTGRTFRRNCHRIRQQRLSMGACRRGPRPAVENAPSGLSRLSGPAPRLYGSGHRRLRSHFTSGRGGRGHARRSGQQSRARSDPGACGRRQLPRDLAGRSQQRR